MDNGQQKATPFFGVTSIRDDYERRKLIIPQVSLHHLMKMQRSLPLYAGLKL